MPKYTEIFPVRSELPFVPQNDTLLYLQPEGADDLYIGKDLRFTHRRFKTRGFEFLFLPELVRSISASLIGYNLPNFTGKVPDWHDIQHRFRTGLALDDDKPAMVQFADGRIFFRYLTPCSYASPVESFLYEDTWGKFLEKEINITPQVSVDTGYACNKKIEPSLCHDSGVRFSIRGNGPSLFDEPVKPKTQRELEDEEIRDNEKECDQYAYVNISALKRLGINAEILAQILGTEKKLSKVHVTRNGRIFLEDYGKEVVLDDLSKSLYLLFLRHEEGIRIKDLSDHYRELLDYYQSISGRDDKLAMEQTIRNLVAPYNNSVNVLISRIKKSFIKAYDPALAEKYYIGGQKGEAKGISLDRSLVIWDAIRPAD